MKPPRDDELGRLLASIDEAPPTPSDSDARLFARIDREVASSRPRPRRAFLSWRRVAVACVAVAAAVAAVLAFGLPSGRHIEPQPATAEAMVAKLNAALWHAHAIQADFTETLRVEPSPGRQAAWASWRGSLAATADGSYRWEMGLDGTSPGVAFIESFTRSPVQQAIAIRKKGGIVLMAPAREVSLYDAASLTSRWTRWDRGGRVTGSGATVRWPVSVLYAQPDDPLDFLAEYVQMAALIRAAVAGNASLPVTVVSYEGRPAWQVTVDLPLASKVVSRATITIDQATGVMVHSVYRYEPSTTSARNPDHAYVSDLRFTNVRVDASLPASTFTQLPPTAPTPTATPTATLLGPAEPGGRTLIGGTVADAGATAGFTPLVPATLPHGFAFATAASGLGYSQAAPAGPLAVPWAREVDLLYRSGFDWLEVAVAKEEKPVGDLRDVFSSVTRSLDMTSSPITAGALKGETAWYRDPKVVWATPNSFCATQSLLPYVSGATVVVFGRDYGVYVHGSLTTDQLLQVVASLKVAQP